MVDHPFPNLKVSNFDFLDDIKAREKCSHCGKSRMYYCYTCFKPLKTIQSRTPTVRLPFHVDIIKHPGEVCGKSTSVHAAILAPQHVSIHVYPDIPQYLASNNNSNSGNGDYNNKDLNDNSFNNNNLNNNNNDSKDNNDYKYKSKIVLLYPCDKSMPLKDYLTGRFNTKRFKESHRHKISDDNIKNDNINSFKNNANDITDDNCDKKYLETNHDNDDDDLLLERVVFIDSTWFQAYKILNDPRLQCLPRIELNSHETKFWRYQLDKPATYLSTIEAIYHCVKEFDDCLKNHLQTRNDAELDQPTYNMEGNITTSSPMATTPTKDKDKTSQEQNVMSNTTLPSLTAENYDDLLFFFSFFYCKIRKSAGECGRILKSYTHQRKQKKNILVN